MVVVGTDVHKRTHTFVAVDEVGRKLGEKAVAATTTGHRQGAGVGPLGVRRRTCCGVSRTAATSRLGLERDLLTAGQKVVRVPPKLMAQAAGLGAYPGQVRSHRRVGRGAGGIARILICPSPSTMRCRGS